MTQNIHHWLVFLMTLLLVSCETGSNSNPSSTIVPFQPAPAQRNTGGTGSFLPYNANSVAPEFILEEVGYFATGGPTVCFTASEPQVQDMPENVEWFQPFALITCGWNEGEVVNVTLTDPNGNSVSERNIARMDTMDLSPAVMYFITPSSVGQYQFLFEGDNTSLHITIPVYKPFSPRMYVWGENNKIVFYSLSSNENITLLAYSIDTIAGTINFVGWEDFQADSDGILVVDIADTSFYYFAMGEESGYLQEQGSNFHPESSILR